MGSDIPAASRRAFLATGAAVSVGSLVGCLGGGESAGEGPEPPWTTEELADHIDDDASLTIYAGTGSGQQWRDLKDVINDEFDMNIKVDVFASDSASVTQRFTSERQAGEDKADLVSTLSDLNDQVKAKGKEEGLEMAKEWYEWDIDQNFWFGEELPDEQTMPYQVAAFNGGATVVTPVNEQAFGEQGLDYPTNYNDLFDEQYEGMDVVMASYVGPYQVGWIIKYHAAQTDMSETEWIETLMSRFNLIGANSHSDATREVGKGNAAMMFYNWPESAAPFVKNSDLNVEGLFTDPVKGERMTGPTSINKNAQNPWVARFFLSAMLEKSVQRRMYNDVVDMSPNRTDLDLSGLDLHPYTKNRMNADLDQIGFWESSDYIKTGQEAVEAGYFKP